MKKSFFIFLLFLSPIFACYSQTVSIDSLSKYEGKTVKLCAKVQSTYITKGDKKTTYLNFGNPYPNSTFMVVIFESDLPNFKYSPVEFLKDKEVCIKGKVKIYKGKPEIIVSNEEQIKVE